MVLTLHSLTEDKDSGLSISKETKVTDKANNGYRNQSGREERRKREKTVSAMGDRWYGHNGEKEGRGRKGL